MGFVKTKIVQPVVSFLKQGITPKQLAATLAAGMVIGLFPLLGVTTIICTVLALKLKLNQPAIQLANYVVYPIQILLWVPFIKAGQLLFGQQPLPFSVHELVSMFTANYWATLSSLGLSILMGIIMWCLVAQVLFVILYQTMYLLFSRFKQKTELAGNTEVNN